MANAVGAAAVRLPVHTTCLDRATAAQMMLRLRRSPGVVVIGLAPSEGWGAHAWLVGQGGCVVGGSEASRFTSATIFAPRGKNRLAGSKGMSHQ